MSDESDLTSLKSEQTESVPLTFRPVTELDLPGLEWDGEYRHFRQLYADTFQRTRLGITQMWVAVDSTEKIIGQVFVQLNSANPDMADGKSRAYVFGFRVRDDYRSLGIGSLMMGFVENDLRQRGFTIVCLNVAKDNPRAIFLYQRLGYLINGPDPGTWSYQDDAGNTHYMEEPAWRMEKTLVSASQKEK
jgi:ribosomal protein S18 acetylase RimI-like enzyme